MFGRARSEPFVDEQLGALVRSRGRWRGSGELGTARGVPLSLPGGRREPDAEALALARTVSAELPRWLPAIAAALAEHGAPLEGEPGAPPMDAEGEARRPVYVAIVDLRGRRTVEIGYRVGWDVEHTLGARLRDGELIELNGSVLEP